ncbi:periaxin [Accipiter gentilis]|uniref:periaxin n=1 Tax=Astur gentilis TaxID=8957 RepID=UPI00210F956A|nr:periaxin [Accipiter gentilis]
MEEDAELVELETAPEAGVTGVTVARDRHGLYIAKAPKSLRVHQGDQLLSARVFFEGVPPEDVARVLESARSCKVSLCLRHRTPGTRIPLGSTSTGSEGHQGKVARLSIPILTPSKKPPQAPSTVSTAAASTVAVEFALPKLPKLVKSQSTAEPAPTATSTAVLPAAEPKRPRVTPSRLTVKEAAARKTPVMEEQPVKPEFPGIAAEVPAGTGTRLPAVEVAAPKVSMGLSLAGTAPLATLQAKEPALRLPQLEVAVPALTLPAVMPEPITTISQPQIKLGEGDTPRSSHKGGGSPVPKTKLPNSGVARVEDKEGDAGTRGGFAGIRVPSIGIAIPSAAVELVPELSMPKLEPAISVEQPQLEVKLPARRSESPPAAPARLAFPAAVVPSIEIAVPHVGVGLALPAGADTTAVPDEGVAAVIPDMAARFAKGLQKLSLELEPKAPLPAVEIATPAQLAGDMPATSAKPKPPKFTLPRFGLSLAKLKTGSDGNGYPPASRGTTVPAPPSIAVAGPAVALDLALGTAGATGAGTKLKVPKLSLAPFGVKDGDKGAGGEEGPQDASAVMKLPQLGIGGSGGDEGRSAELGSPGTPRLRVPRVGIDLPATGSRRVPSLPKLPAGPELGGVVKLPKFGGSSPDIRIGGDPKMMRRGGSAESLSIGTAGRKMPESPGTFLLKLKTRGATGDGGVQPLTPRFSVPAVGFTMPVKQPEEPVSRKIPKPTSVPALKVPMLELAPPGMDGMEETTRKDGAPGRQSRVKLPKFSAGFAGSGLEGEGRTRMGSMKKAVLVLVKPKEKGEDNRVVDPHPHVNGEAEGKARRRRWMPRVGFSPGGSPPEPPITQPKVGKMRLPNMERSPGDPEFNRMMTEVTPRFNLGGFRGEGTPKFHLPKVALTPQPCGEQ